MRRGDPVSGDDDGRLEAARAAECERTVRIDLQSALARLKPVERLCIVLAYGDRMSHGEICEATRLPLGTVKSHIARGSSRLRHFLKDYAQERE